MVQWRKEYISLGVFKEIRRCSFRITKPWRIAQSLRVWNQGLIKEKGGCIISFSCVLWLSKIYSLGGISL